MTKKNSWLVTGAAGKLGTRVVELLLESDEARVIAGTRNPSAYAELARRGAVVRRVDFDDPDTVREAAADVSRVLLISTDSLEPGQRGRQHTRAIEALAGTGVEHVVYTSLAGAKNDSPVVLAKDHVVTEQALVRSGLGHTILRNNMYTDVLLMSLPAAVSMGKLFAATGYGGAAYVTREDCARAAAAALSSRALSNRTLEITGPAVVTHAEIARLASELSGKTVEYVRMSPDALIAAMGQKGVPEPLARLFASFDVGMERGLFGPATTAFRELTGREPTSVADFLAANRKAWVGGAN